jgi:hypothetical protein
MKLSQCLSYGFDMQEEYPAVWRNRNDTPYYALVAIFFNETGETTKSICRSEILIDK